MDIQYLLSILNYMVNSIEEKINLARTSEKDITILLKSIGSKYNATLKGLRFKFKKTKKIYEKIKYKSIRDILRYTFVLKDKDYVSGVYNIYSELINNKNFKTKHLWNKQKWCLGDMYQGINTSWLYKDLFIFEIQFHTNKSFAIKMNKKNHTLYDKYNSLKCDELYINKRKYNKSKCKNIRSKLIRNEKLVTIPKLLRGDNCGTTISDFNKLTKRKYKKTN